MERDKGGVQTTSEQYTNAVEIGLLPRRESRAVVETLFPGRDEYFVALNVFQPSLPLAIFRVSGLDRPESIRRLCSSNQRRIRAKCHPSPHSEMHSAMQLSADCRPSLVVWPINYHAAYSHLRVD